MAKEFVQVSEVSVIRDRAIRQVIRDISTASYTGYLYGKLYGIAEGSEIGRRPLTDSPIIGMATRIVLSLTHEVLNTGIS